MYCSTSLTTSTIGCTRCHSTCRRRSSTVRGCTVRICIWTRTRCRRPAAVTSPATVGKLQPQWRRWRLAAAPAAVKPSLYFHGRETTKTTTATAQGGAAQRRTPSKAARRAHAADDGIARYLANGAHASQLWRATLGEASGNRYGLKRAVAAARSSRMHHEH